MISIRSYRKKKPFILPLILLFLAAVLVLTSPLYIRTVFSIVFYPAEIVGSAVWRGVINIPSTVISITSTARQNTILKRELRQYKAKTKLFDELAQENARLRSSLGYKGNSPYSFGLLPAEVIGKAPSPWYTVLEVNRGYNSGVRKGAAVVFREGLVGRVFAVEPFSSKIMIITDANSSIAAQDSRSRDFGVVEGWTGNKLFMRYVGAGASIQVGDKITTSNLSTLFPPGIPIGTVTKIRKQEQELFYQIEIKPAVDFSKLEEVFIVI